MDRDRYESYTRREVFARELWFGAMGNEEVWERLAAFLDTAAEAADRDSACRTVRTVEFLDDRGVMVPSAICTQVRTSLTRVYER